MRLRRPGGYPYLESFAEGPLADAAVLLKQAGALLSGHDAKLLQLPALLRRHLLLAPYSPSLASRASCAGAFVRASMGKHAGQVSFLGMRRPKQDMPGQMHRWLVGTF